LHELVNCVINATINRKVCNPILPQLYIICLEATKYLFSPPLSLVIGVKTIDNENYRSRQNLGLTVSNYILGPVCHVRTLEDLSFPACHPPVLKRIKGNK